MIRGYKLVWDNPVVGENLLCEREIGNHHDTYAVAVKKIIDGNLTMAGPSYGSFLMRLQDTSLHNILKKPFYQFRTFVLDPR